MRTQMLVTTFSVLAHLGLLSVLLSQPAPEALSQKPLQISFTSLPTISQKTEQPKLVRKKRKSLSKKKTVVQKKIAKVEKKPIAKKTARARLKSAVQEALPSSHPVIDENLKPSEGALQKNALFEKSKITYQQLIASLVARQKRYPRSARRRGKEGMATVEFMISSTGQLTELQLLKSSGNSALDKEALNMIRRAAPFPSFPSELKSDSIGLLVPIAFELS